MYSLVIRSFNGFERRRRSCNEEKIHPNKHIEQYYFLQKYLYFIAKYADKNIHSRLLSHRYWTHSHKHGTEYKTLSPSCESTNLLMKLWSGDTGFPEMTTNLATNFDEYTSQFSQYASFGYKKEESIMKLRRGDTGFPEMTTKSSIRPILIVNGSVLLRISTSIHRSSRKESIMKLWSGDTGFPEMTTKSSVRPILIVNGSVLLRISTSTHRSSRSTHPLDIKRKSQCKMKLWSGDTGFPEMTTKSSVRPILIVNGSVLLRILTSTHRSSRSTHSPENQIMKVGILSHPGCQ
ncbi:hypothetical protein V1477_014679 [Vespula maculifrons]|uniref:Maturase K n=1 Tax=Vespula maculifrons TaxID=7453 RepID=A0ABD2BJ51_VESMC